MTPEERDAKLRELKLKKLRGGESKAPEMSTGEDVGRSFGSGLVRGSTAIADLPADLVGAAASGLNWVGAVGDDFADRMKGNAQALMSLTPFRTGRNYADTHAPGARTYEPKTTAGEYARTVGEFIPGAAASGAGLVGAGVVPGLASEAAGQATEGTALEPAARLIGAVAGPVAFNMGTRAFQGAFKASQAKPSMETLQGAKTAAYKAVDDAGEVFTGKETKALFDRVKTVLDDGNYVTGVDKQTDAALTLLERKAGSELKLGQLDKIRQALWKRYTAAPNETGILDAIDGIDDLIASRASTNDLLAAARVANSRYKKAQLLDDAFTKAADQTASTGSGGNILNKYRQAVTNIINNPRHAKWFSEAEIESMRNFIRGSFSENAMRRFGKLAPGGNGLMLALNLGAAAVEPTMLGITAAASASKAGADIMARRGAENVMRTVAGQSAPQGMSMGAPAIGAFNAAVNR